MVYEIDPLDDVRWPRLLARHKLASVFHSPEWLDSIRRTYGYSATVITTSAPNEELRNAVAFCRVKSRLTGDRVISVPFSDHCAPLVENTDELECLVSKLKQECGSPIRKYVEIRSPMDHGRLPGFSESAKFHLHRIDLRPSLDELLGRLHASCVRRRISRAMREDLDYEEGRSETLLQHFYRLALLTRRRQKLPPHPLKWFRNLIACLGNRLKLRLLFHSGRPAAGILTIHYGNTMTYKYGFSDEKFHRFGSMPLLLWKAIQDAKAEGLTEFDMGRSDWTDDGLVQFKDRWGAVRSSMVYLRYPGTIAKRKPINLGMQIGRRVLALAPDAILVTAGNLLYRHMA